MKDKAEHTEDLGSVKKPATKTEAGLKSYKCAVCKRELRTEEIEKLPEDHKHDYTGDWQSDSIGHWKVCSCGETNKTEHDYTGDWQSDPIGHWKVCFCGATHKSAHTGDWEIVTEATTEQTGLRQKKCAGCKYIMNSEVIPKIDLMANKIIGGKTLEKTTELAIIPEGETATVDMKDDSSWNGYLVKCANLCKGVFIKDRKITLSAFSLGQYEVTQELFETVMGNNPSSCKVGDKFYEKIYVIAAGETSKHRPVENVSWYDAITFCNKLSILEGLEPCYAVSGVTDWANLAYSSIPTKKDSDWNAATCDFTKKGYRLPTETEWEFAARGGDSTKPEWKYAFSGVDVSSGNKVYDGSNYLDNDANLEDYAWYDNNAKDKGRGNAGYGTHEVGKKLPNRLGLYDMSGNVWEWCWDRYRSTESLGTGSVINPTGPVGGSYFRIRRGGSWDIDASGCTVSLRSYNEEITMGMGFRLARTL